jgi:hypothetical protein
VHDVVLLMMCCGATDDVHDVVLLMMCTRTMRCSYDCTYHLLHIHTHNSNIEIVRVCMRHLN